MIVIDAFLNGSKYVDKIYSDPVRIRIDKTSFDKASLPRIGFNSLSFENCTFHSEVSISTEGELDKDFHVHFSGCLIDSFTSLIEEDKLKLIFSNNVVKHFVSKSKLSYLSISNCLGIFFIENCKNLTIGYEPDNIRYRIWKRIAAIKQNIFETKTAFYLDKNSSTTIHFEKRNINKKLKTPYLRGDRYQSIIDYNVLYIPSDYELEKMDISFSLKFNEDIEQKETFIKNAQLRSLTLSGELKGRLNIENLIAENIFIHGLNSSGIFNFMNVKCKDSFSKSGKFEIHKSLLQNTWFYGVRFDTFSSIALYKTSLSEVKITSSVFPKVRRMNRQIQSLQNIHQDERSSDFYREQYDLFIELKQVFEKYGNVYEAQKMKAVAHNSLRKVQDARLINDKFVLGLNRWSNYHGTSPLLAFFWFIFFLALFQTLSVLSYESIFWEWSSTNTLQIIKENIKYITILANPVHRLSELGPSHEITTYTYLVSFVSRIVLGFLYYQFISAFRRFGRG